MRITLSLKKADIKGGHHWFSSEMVCENLAQEFHTDDVSLHPFSPQFRDKIFFRDNKNFELRRLPGDDTTLQSKIYAM